MALFYCNVRSYIDPNPSYTLTKQVILENVAFYYENYSIFEETLENTRIFSDTIIILEL